SSDLGFFCEDFHQREVVADLTFDGVALFVVVTLAERLDSAERRLELAIVDARIVDAHGPVFTAGLQSASLGAEEENKDDSDHADGDPYEPRLGLSSEKLEHGGNSKEGARYDRG